MTSHHHSTPVAVIATSTAEECVGPVALPPAVTSALRGLTEAAAADGFLALWICASVLASRVSTRAEPHRVCIIQGMREALASAGVLDAAISFRNALSRAAQSALTAGADPSGPPADVIIVVSQDARRLYVECGAGVEPSVAHWWARSFVHLLASIMRNPDAAMAGHPLLDEASRAR